MSSFSRADLYPSNLKRKIESLEKRVFNSRFAKLFPSILVNPAKKLRMSSPIDDLVTEKMYGRDDFLLNPNCREDLESWKEIASVLDVPLEISEFDKMVCYCVLFSFPYVSLCSIAVVVSADREIAIVVGEYVVEY